MTNADIETVLSKLVAVTNALSKEVAELVRDTKGNVLQQYRQEVLKRADGLVAASLELRQAFDKAQGTAGTESVRSVDQNKGKP